jgi:hypothetical protein
MGTENCQLEFVQYHSIGLTTACMSIRTCQRKRERERGGWCILRERLRKKRGERNEESESEENGVCRKRGREKERGERYVEKKGSMFKREKDNVWKREREKGGEREA